MREAQVQRSVSLTKENRMFAQFITNGIGGERKPYPVEVPENNIEFLKVPTGTSKILLYSGTNPENLRTILEVLLCGDPPSEDLGDKDFWEEVKGHRDVRLWKKTKYPT